MDRNRQVAYFTLLRIQRDQAYSNLELNNQIRKEKPESPSFVRELVYAVLRNRDYLDYLGEQMVSRGFRRLKPEPLTLLRMGMAQILFLDSVPDHAAVNETVRLAKRYCRYQAGMINGVLRNYLRDPRKLKQPEEEKSPQEALAIRYSVHPSIIALWREQLGSEELASMLTACQRPAPVTVRVNTHKLGREDLKERMEAQGFTITEHPALSPRMLEIAGGNMLESESYRNGYFSPQGAGSIMAVDALDPKPGETVIDVCAAPGGKTLAAAESMADQGRIIAMDVYENKLKELKRQAERLGLSIVRTIVHDGTEPDLKLAGIADRVICDVPCSGLGVLRKKPEIRYRPVIDGGRALAEMQRSILESAAVYLKKEGTLLYSTCTVNRIENQEIAEGFLREHPDFRKISERQLLPDGVEGDGFYYCVLRKV